MLSELIIILKVYNQFEKICSGDFPYNYLRAEMKKSDKLQIALRKVAIENL